MSLSAFNGGRPPGADRTRRRFVAGLAAGGLVAGGGFLLRPLHAATTPVRVPELGGRDFDLVIGEQAVNFTGAPRLATTVNGSLPAPVLRWREGDTVTLRVRNALPVDTSIHWHGLILPANMDGVPGFSFHGIRPGETFTYRFEVKQHGTYWYHSHSGFQEQTGLYGAIVIEPRDKDPIAADRDHVIVLSDWTDEALGHVYAKLKKQSDYYNHGKRTLGDFLRDARRDGVAAALADRRAWGAMRMSPTDLADISGWTYTYLANGTTPQGNYTALFRPGEKVRLRFVNGSAMSYFDVRIPGLRMTVVAADGQRVHPVTVDEFRLGTAETLDVIVEPAGDRPYTIFAQSLDRSGYARATLSPQPGLAAEVPALDRRAVLSMADMGHAGMDHDGMGHGADKGAEGGCGAAMSKGSEGGCGASMMAATAHASHGRGQGSGMLTHPASEAHNPFVDMQTMAPSRALDDPGIGLRPSQLQTLRAGWQAGHKVLTYADLHSVFPDPDGRDPGRDVTLHLTGHMERYVWSFDGVRFDDAEPLSMRYGERLRLTLVNDTMMEHPIHLHGMWSDLENADGAFQVRKHTVSVPPGHTRSYRVTADALGRWAYHCHLLLHMEAGMFREVRVDA